jgi:hypothetical protein
VRSDTIQRASTSSAEFGVVAECFQRCEGACQRSFQVAGIADEYYGNPA